MPLDILSEISLLIFKRVRLILMVGGNAAVGGNAQFVFRKLSFLIESFII